MAYLLSSIRNGERVRFLKFGDWTIEKYKDPRSVSKEQVDKMVSAITCSDLRKMIGEKGEFLAIQAEPHSVAELSNSVNEDIVELLEIEVDWKNFDIEVCRKWTVHVRLEPPLVKAVQNAVEKVY